MPIRPQRLRGANRGGVGGFHALGVEVHDDASHVVGRVLEHLGALDDAGLEKLACRLEGLLAILGSGDDGLEDLLILPQVPDAIRAKDER